MVGIAELLRLRPLDADTHELVETIGKSGDALVTILDDVLDLAYGLRSTGIEVERTDAPRLPLALADADQLAQVFLNLVINAQQALETVPPPRKLWVRTRAGRGVVRVEIADNGPGVPAELQDTVFYPLITGRQGGTGLGLAVAQDLIGRHDGLIEFDSRPGRTGFTTLLPFDNHELGQST